MKTALITGCLGQDGTYLAEHLLENDYKVFGLIRKSPFSSKYAQGWLIKHLWKDRIEFIYGDMRDEQSLRTAIKKSWPDEIYNLAGQVFVPVSWEMPETTFDVNVGGLARILKIVKDIKRDTKIYQASSSEMYGNHEGECDDKTPMWPTSPYGISKLAAHRLVSLYRDSGLFVVAGILFNHESPRRGHEMVTRKIVRHIAQWAVGQGVPLKMGDMSSRRDWGFAGEYVKAMHLMLQQDEPDDYVVGTGESHSVQEFFEEACRAAEINPAHIPIETDARMVRQQGEIHSMRADNRKIREVLDWEPTIKFKELVHLMVQSEIEALEKDMECEKTSSLPSY